MKKIVWFLCIALLVLSLAGCMQKTQTMEDNIEEVTPTEKTEEVVYDNTQYGFTFALPQSWEGYTVLTETWEGTAYDEEAEGEKTVEQGPKISIRHPQWTKENPRQDIPIMIFTLSQWDALQQEEFHIGAAPIGPSELGRNDQYVFALPARYNFAFLTGYEEVEDILKESPLQTNNDFKS